MGAESMQIAQAAAQAVGKVIEGVDAFQRSRYQASVLSNQARAARDDAGVEIQLQLEESARDIGKGLVLAAKGGGGLEGNARDVLSDYARQNLYEVQRLAVAGDNASRAALADAKMAKRAGNLALVGALIQAGGIGMGAKNAAGDGTILSDVIEARRARGQRSSTSAASSPIRSAQSRPLVPAFSSQLAGAPAPFARRQTGGW